MQTENDSMMESSNRFLCKQENILALEYLSMNNKIISRNNLEKPCGGSVRLLYDDLNSRPKLLCSIDLEIRGGNNHGYFEIQ
jgi:hypothetical protein